jgi:hypothetical protein
MWRCQALQDLFHAGQAGVEGDLDQLSPHLFAAVGIIGQVEGGAGEQVGSSAVACVRDRPQARDVEDVGDRPFAGASACRPGWNGRAGVFIR